MAGTNTGGPSSRYEYITRSKHVVNILRNRKITTAYMGTQQLEFICQDISSKKDLPCSYVVFIAAPVLLRLVLKRISRTRYEQGKSFVLNS